MRAWACSPVHLAIDATGLKGRREGAGGDEVAGLGAGRAPRLHLGPGADETGCTWQAQLAREVAVPFEPAGVAEDGGAALLDAAMALVEIDVGFQSASGIGEGGLDLGAEGRLIGLDGEQPVGALGGAGDGAGDAGVGGDGVDRDERALQPVVGAETFQERRDGGEFARLVRHRLGGQHKTGAGGEGAGAPRPGCGRGEGDPAHRGTLLHLLPRPLRRGRRHRDPRPLAIENRLRLGSSTSSPSPTITRASAGGHGARNMATVRHLVLNLVRTARDRRSIKSRRKIAGWGPDHIDLIVSSRPD